MQPDPALGTRHERFEGGVGDHGASRRRDRRAVPAGNLDLEVDAGVAQQGGRGELIGQPEEVMDERQRVDPDVEQRTAPEQRVEEAVARDQIGGEAEVCPHGADLPDPSRGDQLAQGDERRNEPHPHRFHEKHARCPCRLGQPAAGGGIESERLLAEDRDSGRDAREGVLEVPLVGRRDIYRIEIAAIEERGVG